MLLMYNMLISKTTIRKHKKNLSNNFIYDFIFHIK